MLLLQFIQEPLFQISSLIVEVEGKCLPYVNIIMYQYQCYPIHYKHLHNCIFKYIIYLLQIYRNRLIVPMRSPHQSLPLDEQLINAFQMEKQQISKMKEQNRILASFSDKVTRKDAEIEKLEKLVVKYKKYYDQYDLLKATLTQQTKSFDRQAQQNKILLDQMRQTVAENKQLQQKLLNAQKAKHQFVKQKNASDSRLRGAEQIFKQYQQECKNKQRQLLQNLEKAYRQIQQLNNKIEDLQTVRFQNEQLKAKITNFNTLQFQSHQQDPDDIINSQGRQNMSQNNHDKSFAQNNQNIAYSQLQSNPRTVINYSKSRQKSPNKSQSQIYDQDANAEIERLRRDLIDKQIQLQRSKALNHGLSIQFDKSVSKMCQFQKQLSAYRKQNHELKKTLSLFVQKEQYEKMHKNKIRKDMQDSNEQSQQEQEDDDIGYGDFSDSHR